jgi:hypothetical protein
MGMTTKGFEAEFYERLEKLLADQFPEFTLEIPRHAEWASGPSPDFMVGNPQSGVTIAGELKAGYSAEHLPIAMLPQIRAIRDRVAADRGGAGEMEMIVISTGKIPRLVQQGLERDGIEFFEVSTAQEALTRISPRLASL